MIRKFKTPEVKNLPAGTHAPCQLEVTFEEATEERQKKVSWDLKDQWRFRFVLCATDTELHKHTAVQWCNDCDSTLGNLYLFLTDLNGGEAPAECDPKSYDKKWFSVRVRKKGEKQFRAAGADPCQPPADFDAEKFAQQVQNDEGAGGNEDDEDIPF